MTDATELQRYPIGRHERRPIEQPNTPAERAEFIQRLANQSALLAAAVEGLEDDDWQQPFRPGGWTVQQLVHHASSGCAMNIGDLLGSGTISGPEKNQRGSLLEISWNGSEPIDLPGGAKRTFFEDGDSLVIRGWCQGDGYRVGFGEVEGTILPAK